MHIHDGAHTVCTNHAIPCNMHKAALRDGQGRKNGPSRDQPPHQSCRAFYLHLTIHKHLQRPSSLPALPSAPALPHAFGAAGLCSPPPPPPASPLPRLRLAYARTMFVRNLCCCLRTPCPGCKEGPRCGLCEVGCVCGTVGECTYEAMRSGWFVIASTHDAFLLPSPQRSTLPRSATTTATRGIIARRAWAWLGLGRWLHAQCVGGRGRRKQHHQRSLPLGPSFFLPPLHNLQHYHHAEKCLS